MWSDVQVLESHCQKSKVGNSDKDKYVKGYMGDPTQALTYSVSNIWEFSICSGSNDSFVPHLCYL